MPEFQYNRRIEDSPTREEHNDLKERVKAVESKLDRITWLVIATLVTALLDLVRTVGPH